MQIVKADLSYLTSSVSQFILLPFFCLKVNFGEIHKIFECRKTSQLNINFQINSMSYKRGDSMDIQKVRAQAKEKFKSSCRVCRICDGKVCAGETPGMGGCGTGSSFHNNFNALKNIRLNMRLIHKVREPDLSATILGVKYDLPVFVAPIGGMAHNMADAISEKKYITAIIDGAKEAGIMGTGGDGVADYMYQATFNAIKKANGHGIPFIKPWDTKELDRKLNEAFETNCPCIGMDIDAAGLITLALQGRPVAPKSTKEIAQIVKKVHAQNKKFILKGIMTAKDAIKAHEAGCDAIVVSNHGGRALDHTPGTAEVLPLIAKKVKNKMTIFVDGAVRDGFDVLKMLALGADAVMIGRPYSIAAVGAEKEGVVLYTQALKYQLTQAMVLTGCAKISDINNKVISIA